FSRSRRHTSSKRDWSSDVCSSDLEQFAVFEYHGKLLVVDCGVLFPEEDQPGVDLILPDFSYLDDRLDDIVGLVLTHGHEDHIGRSEERRVGKERRWWRWGEREEGQ